MNCLVALQTTAGWVVDLTNDGLFLQTRNSEHEQDSVLQLQYIYIYIYYGMSGIMEHMKKLEGEERGIYQGGTNGILRS